MKNKEVDKMSTGAIIMFLFGAIVLWGGSAFFLHKTINNNE
ncbi:MetS family NSS transporter small subunit [Methanococcus maripaludis]